MGLKLDFCTDEDLARAFEIISLGFKHDHAYVEALWPDHDTPAARKRGADWLLLAKKGSPHSHFIKIVDTETGEMVGFSKWDVYNNLNIDPPRECPPQFFQNGEDKEYADYMWNAFTSRRWDAVKESGGNLVSLDISVVDPKHHRRGAGSLFMLYGIGLADGLGVDAVIEASAMGRYLYQNYGFEILEDVTIPNPPKYADQPDQFIHWMRRPARKSSPP